MENQEHCKEVVIPKGLVEHIRIKLTWGLENWKETRVKRNDAISHVIEFLKNECSALGQNSVKEFHRRGEMFAALLRRSENDLSEILEMDFRKRFAEYEDDLSMGSVVFGKITQHHDAIKDINWEEIDTKTTLQNYADAAAFMGTRQWVKEGLEWIRKFSVDYFSGKANSFHQKLLRRKRKIAQISDSNDSSVNEVNTSDSNVRNTSSGQRIRILDIGSCYNPYAACSEFAVTAIDLCPVNRDNNVLKCDFLRVNVDDSLAETKTIIDPTTMEMSVEALPSAHFDVAVLSLVLCYLPTAEQRMDMIRKARQVLCSRGHGGHPGLLMIFEKESILHTKDMFTVFLQHWKDAIQDQGFDLLTYQRFQCQNHVSHGFAFRVSDDLSSQMCSQKLHIRGDFMVSKPQSTHITKESGDAEGVVGALANKDNTAECSERLEAFRIAVNKRHSEREQLSKD